MRPRKQSIRVVRLQRSIDSSILQFPPPCAEQVSYLLSTVQRERLAKSCRVGSGPKKPNGYSRKQMRLDVEFGALLVLLCYTGLRLSEALGIEIDLLRLRENFIYVRRTKNAEPRAVHIPKRVIDRLQAIPAGLNRPGARLFRFHKSGHLYSLLTAAAARASITLPERQAFHLLRHTYGTWMRRYGGLDTRGLVGTGAWKDRKSAERYEHVVTSEEARRSDLLPGGDGLHSNRRKKRLKMRATRKQKREI